MTDKLYIIIRHDEHDGCTNAHYAVASEAEAQKIVKHLNETDGMSIICEDDGSMANICDDDAIWYDYDEVEVVKDCDDLINKVNERN